MKPIKKKNIVQPVILIKILDNGELVAIDSKTIVRFYNKDTLEVLNGFKVNIEHERYRTSIVAFSSDGKYFATLSADCRESRLYNADTKKLQSKVGRHQGEVSCVSIDPKNRYMFSCGDDGKTFAVDMKSAKLAFTLPMHVDTVNDIAFSRDGQWVATASYDRKISIFNLDIMTQRHKLKFHSAPVMNLLFLSKHRLLSIDKNSKILVTNIHTGELISRVDTAHDDVIRLTISDDSRFLFLGTALGYVIVYDLDEYKLITRDFIKLSTTVTSIVYDQKSKHLIVGSKKGDILVYDIYDGLDDMKVAYQNQEFDKIEKYTSKNPLLKYTKTYKIFENLWEKTYEKAKLLLEMGDKQKAIKIFQPFKNIPSKNQMMQKLLVDYEDFEKFATVVKQRKFPVAYSLANTNQIYKDSNLYKAMEKEWKKAFRLARQYTMDPRGADKAREILKPYRGISEKTKLVQDLLTQGEVYKRFRASMSQKDFKICFELIRQYPFLKEFPEYDSLMAYADTLYIKSQEAIKKDDTHAAIKMLRILVDFNDFKDEAEELIKEVEKRQKFFNAIENKDDALAYNLMATSEDLQNTPDGKKLQEKWNNALLKANECAVKGDVDCLKEALKDYMHISSKYMAIATVFAWCYMTQLENAIKKKEEQSVIENGIRNYILSFGVLDQMENFFNIFKKYYPESKLALDMQTKGSLSMWRPSMIVNSILE
jgi:hypothetical protein